MWKGIVAAVALALAYQNPWLCSFLPSPNKLFAILFCLVCFPTFLVVFVNYYIGKELRKCSPLNEHLGYVNEETQSSECIKDLDKVASPKGLGQLWREEIHDKNVTIKVLLTGVTGYVGRAFLFQLLREIAEAERDSKSLEHRVYVLARPKARKRLTAAQRLANMQHEPMFATVRGQWERVVVAVESGDLAEDKCGMSEETLEMLADAQLTHVVHCAADVNFNRPLEDSASINISPALQLQAVALTWPSCRRFVHCSTAFVNPGCGTPDAPMTEELFPLGKYDPQDLYDSMKGGDPKLAVEAKTELHFSNNYVFTKCVAEHLLVKYNRQFELSIVRPAIVGPSWVLPVPGWNGDKPSTITALFLLWGTRVIRFAPLNTQPTAMVPVDVVAVGIMDAMIAPVGETQDTTSENTIPVDELDDAVETPTIESPSLKIRNLTWSHKSPKKFIDGMRMAKQCIQVGVLKHHFTATEAAVSYALTDLSSKYPFLFTILHRVFNLGPLKLLQFVCWVARVFKIKSILDQLPVTKLINFADMLPLYRPYTGRAYYFESSMNVPPSLDFNQYCISLFTATHAFWTNLFPDTIADLPELELIPEERYDLWWALTLPCGTFRNRLIGYLACKIIRATYGSAEVNFQTLFHAGRTLLKLEQSLSQNQKDCVVLAPTHRSLMDYILAKYIAFSMVGLGIDVPAIFAGAEIDDPKLPERIGKAKTWFDRHPTLAAFLERTPSQDGRLQKPCTQILTALLDSPGDHKYTLIPLCIDYDRLDRKKHEIFKDATRQSSNLGLRDMIRLYLKIRTNCSLHRSYGDVRISFGVPTSLEATSNLLEVANHVQDEHRRLTTVSNYHLAVAETHLRIPADTLRAAMEQLGTSICTSKTMRVDTRPVISRRSTELWRVHLQWLQQLAPFLAESHPKWARWIMGDTTVPKPQEDITKTCEIEQVIETVAFKLDTAESLARQALQRVPDDCTESLVQEMKVLDKDTVDSHLPICQAAASIVLNDSSSINRQR